MVIVVVVGAITRVVRNLVRLGGGQQQAPMAEPIAQQPAPGRDLG